MRHSLTVSLAPPAFGWRCICGASGNGRLGPGASYRDCAAAAKRQHERQCEVCGHDLLSDTPDSVLYSQETGSIYCHHTGDRHVPVQVTD